MFLSNIKSKCFFATILFSVLLRAPGSDSGTDPEMESYCLENELKSSAFSPWAQSSFNENLLQKNRTCSELNRKAESALSRFKEVSLCLAFWFQETDVLKSVGISKSLLSFKEASDNYDRGRDLYSSCPERGLKMFEMCVQALDEKQKAIIGTIMAKVLKHAQMIPKKIQAYNHFFYQYSSAELMQMKLEKRCQFNNNRLQALYQYLAKIPTFNGSYLMVYIERCIELINIDRTLSEELATIERRRQRYEQRKAELEAKLSVDN